MDFKEQKELELPAWLVENILNETARMVRNLSITPIKGQPVIYCMKNLIQN